MKRYKEGIYVGEQDANTMAKKGLGIIFYTNGKLFEGHFAEDKK